MNDDQQSEQELTLSIVDSDKIYESDASDHFQGEYQFGEDEIEQEKEV